MKKLLTLSLAGAFALALSFAADEKPMKAGSAKILQPQMTVEKGTYEKPMATLGETPSAPWSSTTVGASVDGKPNPGGKVATLVGEIVDFSCYLQIGKHGEKHISCAQKCFNNGAPIGLLTKNGDVYMLMEEEHDPRRDGQGTFRAAAVEHAGHIVEVKGTSWNHPNGYRALYVHGYLKK